MFLNSNRCLKNSVIGSTRQKGSVIAQGVVPRLLQLLGDSGTISDRIRLEAAVTLGSLAKGTDQHGLALIDLGVVPLILQVLLNTTVPDSPADGKAKVNDLLIEACLRCLRTIFQHSAAPVHTIYQNPALVPRLLSLASRSVTCQVCIATILTTACKVKTVFRNKIHETTGYLPSFHRWYQNQHMLTVFITFGIGKRKLKVQFIFKISDCRGTKCIIQRRCCGYISGSVRFCIT